MDQQEPQRVPLIVVGGSAGAIEPLRIVLGGLSAGFPAAVCVVVHLPEDAPSALPALLARTGPLAASFAQDGDRLAAGRILVAPPGFHLLVSDDRVRLSRSARENGSRPAIDPLFRTAARFFGPHVTSVVLSGTLDDGAAGTAFVRARGGTTIAQEPGDALFADMPRNAIVTGVVDHVLPAAGIPALLEQLADRAATSAPGMAERGGDPETTVADLLGGPLASDGDLNGQEDTVERGLAGPATDLAGVGSPYSCPDCGGVLFERGQGSGQFLCRIGHRFSPDALEGSQERIIEDALWVALRALEDQASLALRIRDRSAARGDRWMEARFEDRRASARRRADEIRSVLRTAEHSIEPEAPGSAGGRRVASRPERDRTG
jgi:two-component system chemotaxis response regulator CheB